MAAPNPRQAAPPPFDPAAVVRRHDPDRFLAALFAPAPRREALMLLFAVNHELARASEVASEPGIALIRLHWWREVVEGSPRWHELATPLAAALDAGTLDRGDLLAMIDAREAEADLPFPDLEAWRGYLAGTAGGLAVAAGRVLGAPEPEAFRPLGAAYGAAGILRNTRALARHGRCLLPGDVLARHGLSAEAVLAAPDAPSVGAVLADLAAEGRAMLRAGRAAPGIGRETIAAVLPAVLAARDLARVGSAPRPRTFGDKLAVTRAGLRGRLPSVLGA